MKSRLTDRGIAALKPTTQMLEIWDTVVPGLMIRVMPSGVKSFNFCARYPGSINPTRRSLGRVGVISLAEARDKARQWLKLLARGKDPVHEIERERAADLHETIARKFASFAEQGIEPQGYLYRHYGPNGDLLYVGQTMSAWRRNTWHVTKANWRDFIWLIVIEPFATREEALAAEQEAIRNEYPKHNITHNRSRHPFREIERS
jgi:Arm DNA-binding domain